MNVTQLLLEVGDILEDTAANDNYPEAQLVRWADRATLHLFRQLVEVRLGYFSCDLVIPGSGFVEVFESVRDQRLPSWVARVLEARRLPDSASTPPSSPYVAVAPSSTNERIAPSSTDAQPGWRFTAGNVFRLWRWSDAPDISLLTAKKPARIIRVVLTDDADTDTVLHIPQATPALGTLELEEGWYRNGLFECTATLQPDQTVHPVVGQQRRVVQSEPNQVKSAALQTKLTFDVAWPVVLKAGDTLETIIAIPDEHAELLKLMVAMKAFGKKNNTAGQKSISPDLRLELDKFRTFIQPRQSQEPDFYRSETSRAKRDWDGRDPAFTDFWGF